MKIKATITYDVDVEFNVSDDTKEESILELAEEKAKEEWDNAMVRDVDYSIN